MAGKLMVELRLLGLQWTITACDTQPRSSARSAGDAAAAAWLNAIGTYAPEAGHPALEANANLTAGRSPTKPGMKTAPTPD